MTPSNRVVKIVRQMRTLDAMIPSGDGAVSLTLYADLSWEMTLIMWGVEVASCGCDSLFEIDLVAVRDSNPHWLPEVEIVVDKLNKHLNTNDGE